MDIPLTTFSNATPPVDLTMVDQIMIRGNGTVYVDNIYFHGGTAPPAPPAATPLVDFEGDSYTFTDFNGGVVTVIANPQSSGINTSGNVAQMVKDGQDTFGGSTLTLAAPITNAELIANKSFTMKVWATRAVPVLFKLEAADSAAGLEVTTMHSGGSAWETLTFNFSCNTNDALVALGNVDQLTFIFDNGTVGDAAGLGGPSTLTILPR